MALVILNSITARDEIDLFILKKKTEIVNKTTGVQHLEAVQDNGDGTFVYTVSADEADIMGMDYILGMIEAVILIEELEQKALAMARAMTGETLQ